MIKSSISDDTSSYVDIYDDDDNMHSNNDSAIRPKWVEKTIQAVGDLTGDPLDSRKTTSQFHDAFSNYDLNIPDKCFMMVQYYSQ